MSLTPERDSMEFTSGLFLGALVGVGLALLVAPDRSPRARFVRRLRGPRRRLARRARETRVFAGLAADRSGRLGRELRSFGSEFLQAAREELVEGGRSTPGLPRRRGSGSTGRLQEALRRLRELRESSGSSGAN